jgi:hypothetical protein
MEDRSEDRFEVTIRANAKARDFLERLGTDDEFRARLKNDPKQVLRDEFDLDVPEVAHEVQLPSKGAVQELVAQASEPDEFGNVELMPTQSWWLGIIFWLEAMVFVAGEEPEGDAAD